MNHSYVFRHTMLAQCRKHLISTYPALATNPAYRRMLDYLLHPNKDDKGRWYLGCDVLRQITGGTMSNQDFLEAFRRDVLPGFSWSDPNRWDKQARTIISSGIDAVTYDYYHMAQAVMHARPGENKRVYIDDGKMFSRSKKAKLTRHNDQVMREEANNARTPIQSMILRYHADLPTNTYQALITANRADACAWVQDTYRDDDDARRVLWGQLDNLLNHPKPYYAASSDKTNRLYPAAGMANLSSAKREIRRILTRGCIEADIWACHLAIIAREWQVTSLQTLLETLQSQGKKPWGYFAAELGLELTCDLKQALKQAVYSLAYGASKRKIVSTFDADSGCTVGYGSRFMQLPVMQDILLAREKQMKSYAVGSDSACDEWGYDWGNYDVFERDHAEIRSLLSCESMAIEQKLVAAIYEYAISHTKQMQVLIYSYDGVTFSIRDKHPERKRAVMQNIKAAVDAKAAEFGLVTSVEFGDVV